MYRTNYYLTFPYLTIISSSGYYPHVIIMYVVLMVYCLFNIYLKMVTLSEGLRGRVSSMVYWIYTSIKNIVKQIKLL